MKINGKKIEGPNEEIIVIPRKDEDIVFRAKAVLNYEEFDKLCPTPIPPMIKKKGTDFPIPDIEDTNYQNKLATYATKRTSWMILKSLEATDGLSWDTIKMSDPDSWENFEKEMKDSGFSDIEINRIVIGVQTANCLNEEKLEEARKRFLASQQALAKK